MVSPFKSSWSLGPNTKTSAFGWHPVHVTVVYCLWLDELDKVSESEASPRGYRDVLTSNTANRCTQCMHSTKIMIFVMALIVILL